MSSKIVIKIFLPKNPKEKFLYGLKKTETEVDNKAKTSNTINSYYVIECSEEKLRSNSLELLGTFGHSGIGEGINVITNNQNNVIEVRLNGLKLSSEHRILLFYYDKNKLRRSYIEQYKPKALESHFGLIITQALQTEYEKETEKTLTNQISTKSRSFLVASATVSSKALQLVKPIFHNTVINQHCCNWRKCLNNDHYKSGFLILDVILGIIFFLLMNHVQDPGRYFMRLAELIVNKLRELLEMLEGSPVGLKLNVQLNNFLLSCFMYHVDLWWNFIVIVEPAIQYLFTPITMIGLMGFSFQCALVCDVITLITLHAHCFYIYAAMLYKLELTSIRSLMRIVVGRRLNVLKSKFQLLLHLSALKSLIFQTALSRKIIQIDNFS